MYSYVSPVTLSRRSRWIHGMGPPGEFTLGVHGASGVFSQVGGLRRSPHTL